MFRKMAALGAFCAMILCSSARAQQYQSPPAGAPTGGGIAAPAQPSESVGGGIADSPYSTYGGNSAAAITGGGLDPVTQGSTGNRTSAVAPNGQTYKALGISGY
jgi:hypothetical protein